MLFSSLQQHGGGEDNGDPVLMVRKVRLQDLIAFLKVTQLLLTQSIF